MKSRIARALTVAALILLTAGCNMTVRLKTEVDPKGNGTFGIGMALDNELRGALESRQGGLSSIDDLFTRLQNVGWKVTKTEPGGGLDYEASRAFKGQKGFESALTELGTAQAGASPLGGLSTSLTQKDSFLKAHTNFSGSIDTSSLVPILKAALGLKTDAEARTFVDSLANSFQFEIQAKLPGSVAISKGDGTVTDGTAIWSPQLGAKTEFAATSSAVKTGSLLLIGIPALLVLAGLGWFLLGRRQRPLITEAPTPAHRRRITIPTGGPAPELLAIKPDVPQQEHQQEMPVVIDLGDPAAATAEPVPPADATG
jgi:hypothetical protein